MLKRKIENLLATATFTEKRNYEMARKIDRKKKVLLVLLGTESDRASFKYALNISKRIDAGLEVLYVSPEPEVAALLASIVDETEKEGVELKVVKRTGCIKNELINHAQKRSDIQLVVLESAEDLDENCTERQLIKAWKRMNCPIVVVSEA